MSDGLQGRRLLLVGWDAVDWNTISPLLRAGLLPNLARLIAGGAAGDLATLYPVTFPIVWTSALTGVAADRHGIFGYADAPDEDAVENRARLVTPADRRVPALWDFVVRRGGRSHVVNWPCSYPAYPAGGIYVSDAATRGLAVDRLEDAPLSPDAIRVSDALSEEDWPSLRMAAGEVEPAVLARFRPASGPIPRWLAPALAACFTVHNFATAALETGDDWELAAFRYPCLLPLAVARSRGGSDILSDAAALDGLLRLHDLFLGRLLELAARGLQQTAVILLSAHGFPARMVGDETDIRSGLVVISGGNGDGSQGEIRGNTRLMGANLLDIAPTALSWLGFPSDTAADAGLSGRVLVDLPPKASSGAKDSSPRTLRESFGSKRDTWQAASLSNADTAEAVVPLAEEGLIPQIQADGSFASAVTVRQSRRWNEARVFAYADRHKEALPILQTLHRELPARDDIALLLSEELYQAGSIPEARAVAASRLVPVVPGATRSRETVAEAHLFFAEDALASGERRDAMEHLGRASDLTASSALLFRIGYAYYRLRRVDLAGPCFTRAADADPAAPSAWMGKAGAALLTRRYDDAIAFARRAIELQHDNALAHLILARALRFANRADEARAAYAAATCLGVHARRIAAEGFSNS